MKTSWALALSLCAAPPLCAQAPAKHLTVPLAILPERAAFSKDGRTLHVIGYEIHPDRRGPLRLLSYDTGTGAVLHALEFPPTTQVFSITADGRTAVIADQQSDTVKNAVLLDTETGAKTAIPTAWYQGNDEPDFALSGDGQLLSVYSEDGTEKAPLVITVYRWADKKRIARWTSEFLAAGGVFGGGITPDGRAVAFESNRRGSTLVDLHTGRHLAEFDPISFRSSDGKWVVEMPNLLIGDTDIAAHGILIRNGFTGSKLGRIRLAVKDEAEYERMSGAHCGNSSRFVLVSSVASVYELPSGTLVKTFPTSIWKSTQGTDPQPTATACSADASRVAILSGSRLTIFTTR